jgi:hypothetical protein
MAWHNQSWISSTPRGGDARLPRRIRQTRLLYQGNCALKSLLSRRSRSAGRVGFHHHLRRLRAHLSEVAIEAQRGSGWAKTFWIWFHIASSVNHAPRLPDILDATWWRCNLFRRGTGILSHPCMTREAPLHARLWPDAFLSPEDINTGNQPKSLMRCLVGG